jgi:hypothetical protein
MGQGQVSDAFFSMHTPVLSYGREMIPHTQTIKVEK